VAEQFSRELGIRVGETTPDREFTLETVNCLGACALGPIVVAEGRYFSKVRPNRVKEILAAVSVAGRQAQEPAVKGKTLTLKAKCPGCGRILTDTGHHIDGEPAIGLRVHAGETTGQLMLSSRYDGGAVRCDSLVSEGTVLRVSCPMCGRTLTDTYCCNECGAPMVAFPLSEGGTLRFCLRWGCKARILDLC
jgi:(2Fe-2S) ferredoxin